MSYTVYKHTTPNNKVYIGITNRKKVEQRWGENGKGYSTQLFGRAIKKYGWENIKHEIIAQQLTREDACALEKVLIKIYKSNDYRYGYNKTSGGDGTCDFSHSNPHSDEWRKKVSIAKTGSHHSEQAKLKMRQAKLGKKLSPEHRESIRNASKTNKLHKLTAEEIEKGRKKRIKSVYQYDLNNNLINVYTTMTECAKALEICPAYVTKLCKTKKIFKNTYLIIGENNE